MRYSLPSLHTRDKLLKDVKRVQCGKLVDSLNIADQIHNVDLRENSHILQAKHMHTLYTVRNVI